MSEIGIISITEDGVDVIIEWKIDNFVTLPQEDDLYYFSPEFSFNGERWCFEIYPNGLRERCTSEHVGLRLWKRASNHSIRQAFSLFLKTEKGKKHKQEHFTKDFGKTYPENHHDIFQFIPRSELTKRPELAPCGSLTVVLTMKNTMFVGRASNSASSASAEICTSETDSAECSSDHVACCHCKGNFATRSLSSHQKKCMKRPIKCPDCLEVVVLQKWLDEHECQQERLEGTRTLYEDYKKMLLDGRDHNLILKVGDKELRAHRDILRARSRVFESMLEHDMKEKNTGIIDVPDCNPNAMQLFLSYVYCGKIEALDHNNMLELYYIADKYEMMELKRECCNFIKKSLSLTNICSVIQLALNHSDSNLLEYATGYFSDNVLDVMQTVEWQSFLKDNSTVGNEILMKSIKKLKNVQS